MKIDESFYTRPNVTRIAKDLIGKVLVTKVRGKITSGIIVETEAYSQVERGSHAYRGRTTRNEIMFGNGGFSYVYLCYGIHNLFNIVTNSEGLADAVLVRALEPAAGGDVMLRRMNAEGMRRLTSGPGKLTKAMAIDRSFNGKYLLSDHVWVEDDNVKVRKIDASPRIGIDYAGDDASLPWRFTLHGNIWVSKP